jgi:hypothetical protein
VCNGHAELCDVSYGEVSFVGAHDSCKSFLRSRFGGRGGDRKRSLKGSFNHEHRRVDKLWIRPHKWTSGDLWPVSTRYLLLERREWASPRSSISCAAKLTPGSS